MKTTLKWVLGLFLTLVLIVVVAGVVLYTFDWNRVKPRINTMVENATGRTFEIQGNLGVQWHFDASDDAGWRAYVPLPRIVAKDLLLGNPNWAEHEHMAQVQKVSFGIELLPLLQRNVVLRDLTLEGAQVALERQDSENNSWTFDTSEGSDTDEDPSDDWKLLLSDIQIAEGKLAYRDAPLELALDANVRTIAEEPSPAGADALPYRTAFDFTGRYREADVKGEGKSGAFLSLRDRDVRYPLQLEVEAGKVAIAAEGRIGNLYEALEVDLNVEVSGDSMAMLYPVTGIVLPNTKPFNTDGHLLGSLDPDDGKWRYEDFNGVVGKSDIHGTLEYTATGDRPKLTGELTSKLLQFADLGPLIGVGGKEADPAAAEKKAQQGKAESNAEPGKVLPKSEFATNRWTAMDLDLTFKGERIVRDEALPINAISTHAILDNGVLTLKPLKFGVAGGTLNANVQLNGRNDPLNVRLEAQVQNVQLPKLFPTIEEMQMSAGRIDGAIALLSRGNSIADMLAEGQGEIKVYLQKGRISRFLLEAASLNIASAVVAKMFGDSEVQISCAAAELALRDGLATARNVRIGTTEALIDITGAIDFQDERLALDIKPETYEMRVLSLRTPLYVNGTFKDPDIGLEKGPLLLRAGAVAAIAAIAPAALALLPVTVPGSDETVDCGKLLASAREKPKLDPDTGKPIEATSVLTSDDPADGKDNEQGATAQDVPPAWRGSATIGTDPSQPAPAVDEFGVARQAFDPAVSGETRTPAAAQPQPTQNVESSRPRAAAPNSRSGSGDQSAESASAAERSENAERATSSRDNDSSEPTSSLRIRD